MLLSTNTAETNVRFRKFNTERDQMCLLSLLQLTTKLKSVVLFPIYHGHVGIHAYMSARAGAHPSRSGTLRVTDRGRALFALCLMGTINGRRQDTTDINGQLDVYIGEQASAART